MKTIHPNQDSQNNLKNANQLNEGEEISLGIVPKQEQIKDDFQNQDNIEGFQKITKIHNPENELDKIQNNDPHVAPHAQGDFLKQSNLGENAAEEPSFEVQKHPRIDLTPGSEHIEPGTISNKKTARQKLKELRSHKYWHNAKLVIGTVLVFLLIFNSQWFISQFMFLFNRPKAQTVTESNQNNQSSQENNNSAEAEVVGPQNEIIIPKIGVTAPLVFINTANEPDVLIALRDGIVHYYGTALPGEIGNSVFFGHSSNDWWEPGNYKFVFVLLEKLTVGDTYEIHYNSRKYVYRVTETKVVAPTDLSVLNQTSEPISTLITCTPPGTSWQRFVVVGKQISPVFNTSTAQSEAKKLPSDSSQSTLPSAPPSLWQQIKDFFSGITGSPKENSSDQKSQQEDIKHLPEIN
jgi:LPXTG-site transpeptidase (sortase) family protein